MEAVVAEVQNVISEGCSLARLVEILRSTESFKLTPLNFMRVLGEAAEVPMMESREIVAMFDSEMSLLVSTVEAETKWRSVIDNLG